MEKALYGSRAAIAAPATPMNDAALATIRSSGSESEEGESAVKLLAGVFSRPGKLLSSPGNTIVHGWLIDPVSGKKVDEVLVSVFRSPHSYTGEDAVDISCHGSMATVKAVMGVLKKAGFREALPGEFTFRAFMNSKMDLTLAEAVMELVAAKTQGARDRVLRRLSGLLEKEILEIKALLTEVLASTEIYLDYSEDEFTGSNDDEESGRLPGRVKAMEAEGRLKALAELWRRERIYMEGALAVLAGRPNAGKSSLFNIILKEDRSIVTSVPGTTRDWIEAQLSLDDIPIRLVDTAGLRTLPEMGNERTSYGESSLPGEAEQAGIKRSYELLERADLVFYVVDGTEGITLQDRDFLARHEKDPKPLIVLWNKSDQSPLPSSFELNLPYSLLSVSAKTGEGIPALLSMASALLVSSSGLDSSLPDDTCATGPGTLRQKDLVDKALNAITEVLSLAEEEEALDLIAPLLRSAVNALGEISGEVTHDDILELMFSRFCVGK